MKTLDDRIKAYLRSLDGDTARTLEAIWTPHAYRKGDFLVIPGQIGTRCFLIESGVGRKFYLHDGKEVTTDLYFKGDLAVSFASYTLLQASTEYIEALTDLSVAVTDHKTFEAAKAKHPKLVSFDLMLVEHHALALERRLFEIQTMSAEERYLQILERTPRLVQQIPLTILASYLGITLETLSRIRARI